MCTVLPARGDLAIADLGNAGCAFVLDDVDGEAAPICCGAPLRPGSAYCPSHHALCHLPAGSVAERRQLREIAALAKAVGGKQGRAASAPPTVLLRRLKRIERAFSRPNRS
jgi:hypothetical protein